MDWDQTDGLSPGEYLQKKILEPMNLSVRVLAKAIKVPPNRLYQILKNEREITIDTAFRLGSYFDTGPEMWLYLQMHYDIETYKSKRN